MSLSKHEFIVANQEKIRGMNNILRMKAEERQVGFISDLVLRDLDGRCNNNEFLTIARNILYIGGMNVVIEECNDELFEWFKTEGTRLLQEGIASLTQNLFEVQPQNESPPPSSFGEEIRDKVIEMSDPSNILQTIIANPKYVLLSKEVAAMLNCSTERFYSYLEYKKLLADKLDTITTNEEMTPLMRFLDSLLSRTTEFIINQFTVNYITIMSLESLKTNFTTRMSRYIWSIPDLDQYILNDPRGIARVDECLPLITNLELQSFFFDRRNTSRFHHIQKWAEGKKTSICSTIHSSLSHLISDDVIHFSINRYI